MKKTKLLLPLLLFISCLQVSNRMDAQIIFKETFDNIAGPTAGGAGTYTFPTGWLLRNVDNRTPAANVNYVNNAWTRREDFGGNVGDSCAFSTSWYSPVGVANDWMWTPAIAIPATGTTMLKWRGKAYDATYKDGYEVRIMVSPTTPTGGAGTIGNQITNSTLLSSIPEENTAWTARSIDISSYAGQTVRISFRNNSNDKFMLVIDDITVEKILNYDASLISITTLPYSKIPKGYNTVPLGGKLKNLGTNALNSITLSANIYDGANNLVHVANGGLTASMAANAEVDYTIGNWTPTQTGNFTIKYFPILLQTDERTSNDTLSTQISITDSVYARDTGNISGQLGIGGGLTGNGFLGQSYFFSNPSLLTSISITYTQGYTGVRYGVSVWNTDGTGKPTTLLGVTDTLLYSSNSAIYTTIPIHNGPLYLAGNANYVFAAMEFDSTMAVAQTTDRFTAGTVWTYWPGTPFGGWAPIENFGSNFAKALVIRPNIQARMNEWTGAVDSSWKNAANWSLGRLPIYADSVVVAAAIAKQPVIDSTAYCRRLSVGAGGLVKLDSAANLKIYKDIMNNGTVNARKGTLSVAGSNQTLNAAAFVGSQLNNLTLEGGSTQLSGNLGIAGTLSVKSGSLGLGNDSITLRSTDSGTARVDSILVSNPFVYNGTGRFVVERYIKGGGLASAAPSKRAFRFLSHPFNQPIAINQLHASNGIDITGSGGSTNGFTATATNSPSVFRYITASGNGGSNDPGWLDYSSALTNGWNSYQGIRAFVRGAKGQGLAGGDYTVGDATLSLNGRLNIGTQTVPLNFGGANWNLVGNPFASAINLKKVVRNNTSNMVYVWKMNQGLRGAYSPAIDVASTDYYLPAYSAFFVQSTAAAASMVFEETHKVGTATADQLFRNSGTEKGSLKLKLQSQDGSIVWDELHIGFIEGKKGGMEPGVDGLKLLNSNVSLYSLSTDSIKLSLDRRELLQETKLPLGLITDQPRSFTLTVMEMGDMGNRQLFLHDRFTGSFTPLATNTSYAFSTSADAGSTGNARFEIVSKTAAAIALIEEPAISISPNPASEMVNVKFHNPSREMVTLRFLDLGGRLIKIVNAGNDLDVQASIPLKGMAKGPYTVQLLSASKTSTVKLIVE